MLWTLNLRTLKLRRSKSGSDSGKTDENVSPLPTPSDPFSNPGYGITILSDGPMSDGVKVDFVAVHGLGGHPLRTWTDRGTRKMWLRDFLPNQIPNARIMTFGYDAAVINGKGVTELAQAASSLLLDIANYRKGIKDPERPLILIGHSLGGIVIKKALVMANLRSNYRHILKSTRGVMFFGVPHDGVDCAKWAQRTATFASLLLPRASINKRRLKELKRNSSILKDISASFGHLQGFRIVSVIEGASTDIGGFGISVNVVPERPLNYGDREQEITLDGRDHRSVCKFAHPDDNQYKRIWYALISLIENEPRVPLETYATSSSGEGTTATSTSLNLNVPLPGESTSSRLEWVSGDRNENAESTPRFGELTEGDHGDPFSRSCRIQTERNSMCLQDSHLSPNTINEDSENSLDIGLRLLPTSTVEDRLKCTHGKTIGIERKSSNIFPVSGRYPSYLFPIDSLSPPSRRNSATPASGSTSFTSLYPRTPIPSSTPLLHQACLNRDLNLAQSVLSSASPSGAIALLSQKYTHDRTPLHIASRKGHKDLVHLLLSSGASLFHIINSQDMDGRTSLHFAANMGYVDVVELLLDSNADREIKCNKGLKALDLAENGGQTECARLLKEPINSARTWS